MMKARAKGQPIPRESVCFTAMSLSEPVIPRSFRPKSRFRSLLFVQILVTLLVISVGAKETPVTAIVLFDGPGGPAYVQVAGLMLNGKTELRVCDGVPKLNKPAYDTLLRTQLSAGTAMERGTDGTLMLTLNSKPVCVLPSNLRFERNAELTPAEAAEQAVLQGTVVSSSIPGSDLPPLKRGVRLVFVAAPDEDMAQFLLAERSNSISGWQDFLERHGASPHSAEAKNALAAIHEQSAESAFAKYQKSADIAFLKQAQRESAQANKAVAAYPAANNLRARISKELDALLEPDRAKLQAFRKALAEQTAGYAQLAAARKHNEELMAVNPEYAPVLNLHSEIAAEHRKLDSAVDSAEALAQAKSYDQALQALGPYRAFAGEEPRIQAIVAAAYLVHFNHGQELAAQQDWEKAVPEFRRAAELRTDSKEASAALKNAESQLVVAHNRQAAQH